MRDCMRGVACMHPTQPDPTPRAGPSLLLRLSHAHPPASRVSPQVRPRLRRRTAQPVVQRGGRRGRDRVVAELLAGK